METNGTRGGKRLPYAIVALLLVIAYLCWALFRSAPAIKPVTSLSQQARVGSSSLQWPAGSQAAVGIAGTSILDMHGTEQPLPTASTAKLITALTVLREKPLEPEQQGPTITLTSTDVALYNNYAAQDGSLVKVQAGEQISEYQMLQTMMLPSANNMADSLAIWAFGSLQTYAQAANQYLEDEGLVTSHVGSDASGLSPTTTSTAHDLVQIGELAMQNPVLAQIVGQPSADGIPVVGTIKNVNSLLGTDGIIGIKTGNSDQAGGVFVSASKTTVNGKAVTVITALMGAPGLWQAMNNSLPLIQSAQANFPTASVVKDGTVVGYYQVPWGGKVMATARGTLTTQAWGGSTVRLKTTLDPISAGSRAGQHAGTLNTAKSAYSDQKSVPATLQSAPGKPSISWRLKHPF